ncbi:MAG: hypothetical protein QOJ81_293 [Chloroflexota bacterium]|nr:hypothetical protein [Chloroflexota bacterium]
MSERVITVSGLTQPGATITREKPFWFDDHVTADNAGQWSMLVELNVGENAINFRVGDDSSTLITLNVYYPG